MLTNHVSMNSDSEADRLAVCSWSLLPKDPQDLVEQLLSTGIRRVQLALDPLRESPAIWDETKNVLQQADIHIVSGMFGCVGEDYSTLESIRATGGIAPDATWNRNLENIRESVTIAASLELKFVSFHAGFVPHDPSLPGFAVMKERLGAVADVFASADMVVALETGQETAAELAILLESVKRPNLAVNFDPANMLLYGKGDPVQALHLLAPWIQQVHIKDATSSPTAGNWGEEVAVGTGEVNWPAFFAALDQIGFTGNLVIEREAGSQRVSDIRLAKDVILKSIPVT